MIYPNSGKVSRTFIEATYVGTYMYLTCTYLGTLGGGSRTHGPSLHRRYIHEGMPSCPACGLCHHKRSPIRLGVLSIVRGQASNQANFGNAGLRGGEGGTPKKGGREKREKP